MPSGNGRERENFPKRRSWTAYPRLEYFDSPEEAVVVKLDVHVLFF
jgi:hypothetical protein